VTYGSSPEDLRDRIDELTKRLSTLEDEVACLRAAAPAIADLERLVKEFRVRQAVTVERCTTEDGLISYWRGECTMCHTTATSPNELWPDRDPCVAPAALTSWLEQHVAVHLAKPGA
jgi:hypothetical protein